MDQHLLEELRRRRRMLGEDEPSRALLTAIAIDYGVPVGEVSRGWDSLSPSPSLAHGRDDIRSKAEQVEVAHVRIARRPGHDWAETSPVAGVVPEPGALTVLPPNAVLIQARIQSGLACQELAWMVGMKPTDYRALEENRLLPTEAQGARIAALLKIPLRNLFIAAAGEPFGTGKIKGLSVLQLLRCRRRLSIKDLCAQCGDVRYTLISAIERGALKAPLTPQDELGVARLADFFGVHQDRIIGQIPPEIFQRVAQNTAALHEALKAASTDLAQTGILGPAPLALEGRDQR